MKEPKKNYIDDKGNYQNVENLTLAEIYNKGMQEGYKAGFVAGNRDEKEHQDVIAGLLWLLDRAIETGFGFDQIPEQYEKYKDDIKEREYTASLIYVGVQEARKKYHAETE